MSTDQLSCPQAAPHQHLTLLDSTSIIVGIVIGATIFRSAPLIAGQVPNVGWLMGVWVIAAAFSLIGALCYAELATAYPKEGGDYVFLTEAFGRKVGFVFAWIQFWIVRPGSIGMMAFVFAEYANQLCPLKAGGGPMLIYAVGAVVVLSVVNLLGVQAGKWTQNLLALVKFLGLLTVIIVGMSFSADRTPPTPTPVPPPASAGPPAAQQFNLGFALILVLLAYSGWHEMAYVSAEVRDPQRNIFRALLLGTLAVAAVYIAANLAFVHALGFAGLQQSQVVGADVLRLGIGLWAGKCISLLICIAALGAINGMIFTGARIFYAMGTEHRIVSWLGRWSSVTDAPARPLIIQAAVAVALTVGFGWKQKGAHGFEDSVAFTSPSFWCFLFLVGVSLFVLRARPSRTAGTYRVPLYPVAPLLFCLTSGYMSYVSFPYAFERAPWGLLASVVVLGIGVALAFTEDRFAAR